MILEVFHAIILYIQREKPRIKVAVKNKRLCQRRYVGRVIGISSVHQTLRFLELVEKHIRSDYSSKTMDSTNWERI